MNWLYEMKLHDVIKIDDSIDVIRVPGGWIYRHLLSIDSLNCTFIPFDNEFKVTTKEST